MGHRLSGSALRLSLLLFDVVLMTIAWLNLASLKVAADLPDEYQLKPRGLASSAAHVTPPRAVLRIEGNQVHSPEFLRYFLCGYARGDSVTVVDSENNVTTERRIAVPAKYSPTQFGTLIFVGGVFFVFALYVIVRHSSRPWAVVLHGVAVGTALMILYEWGSLKLHPAALNAFCWFMFDLAIWMLPSLFLHFSYLYPAAKEGYKRLVMSGFYVVSLTGVGVSAFYLVRIFFSGAPVQDTPYLLLHGTVNDAFLITGLLCTVANLEHSALTIRNAYDRKRIYWVLLGISFGPLVYVFLILVPRTMLDYELVSQSVMQYTLLMAPLMFYLAIRKTPKEITEPRAETLRPA